MKSPRARAERVKSKFSNCLDYVRKYNESSLSNVSNKKRPYKRARRKNL